MFIGGTLSPKDVRSSIAEDQLEKLQPVDIFLLLFELENGNNLNKVLNKNMSHSDSRMPVHYTGIPASLARTQRSPC